MKKQAIDQGLAVRFSIGFSCWRVFDINQGKVIVEYVVKAACIFYALSSNVI